MSSSLTRPRIQISKKMVKGPNVKRRRGRQGKDDKPIESVDEASHDTILIHFTENESKWYECAKDHPDRNSTIASSDPPPKDVDMKALVAKYRSMGEKILRREIHLFAKKTGSSDDKWVETTMRKGTLKDRIAAMSVVVSTNPVHKFFVLDSLLSMAGCTEGGTYQKTNARVAQMAAESIEDLFVTTFLPPNRKLITLDQRPLYLYENDPVDDSKKRKTKKNLSPRVLLLWRYEELVKEKYNIFLRTYMAHTLQEEMEIHKIAAVRSAANLLRSVPEGEATVLQLIANKMGDPEKKVAAAAGHELRKVIRKHPAMQVVIAREVQQLVHRPHLSKRALYNCITFLNQLKLSHDIQAGKTTLPASLVSTYFRLFEVAVKKPSSDKPSSDDSDGGMKSRLLSALLAGIHRAHPYLPEKDQALESHIDALYKVSHVANPSATTQAFLILFHVVVGDSGNKQQSSAANLSRDRFYRALYSKLSDPAMIGAGKHITMFFNLLYKAMKHDDDSNRVQAYAKRLLSTTIHCPPNVTAASLFLLNEIASHHPTLVQSLEHIPTGASALAILDATKREPKGAIQAGNDEGTTGDILAPLWEVNICLNHFHPSVSKFASNLGSIEYSGDPLSDFALAPFLDKFAYRNPKKSEGAKTAGSSVAQRRSGVESAKNKLQANPLNDPSFIAKELVEEHEEFYHRFFVEQARRDKIKGITRHKKSEGSDSEDIEEAEQEAFDEAEEAGFDGAASKTFDYHWDTDEEEEAFVDSLAAKIMEDSTDVNGPVDFDDEDPDMEGWDDMYDSDDKAENEVVDDSSSEESEEEESDANGDEDSGDKDASPNDEDASSEDESMGSDGELAKMAEDSDGSDEESDAEIDKDLPTFAPLEEYEERIAKSWAKRK